MPGQTQFEVDKTYRVSHRLYGVLVIKITSISKALIESTIATKRYGFKRGETLRAKPTEISILQEIEVKP